MHKVRIFIFSIGILFSGAGFADSATNSVPITTANNTMLNILGIKNSAQNISFSDNEQVSVTLSNTDINRIAIQGDKIQNINAPMGLYTARNDVNGAAYLTFNGTLPFTMYLTTVGGHNLSLFINPRPIVGKAVIFQPTTASATTAHWEETSSYQKILVTLITGMINHQTPDGYLYGETHKPKSTDFYCIANLKPLAFYTGSHLTGVVFEIKNKTKESITLRPAYFYQPGVRAVALSRQTINPQATAFLYEVVNRS